MSTHLKEMEVLEELYTEDNPSEINLKKLAKLLDLNDQEVARALKMNTSAFSRNPYASANPTLKEWHMLFNMIVRIFAESDPTLPTEQLKVKMQRWLNTPRPEFGSKTAKEVMLKGGARRVRNLLEQML